LLFVVALLVTDARLGAALSCARATGVCSLTDEKLTGSWNGRIPISAIDRAEVRVRRGRGGSPQVWIVTRSGDYYFAAYTWRSDADKVAQRINDFLRDGSAGAGLYLHDDERALYWVAWAFVPVIVVLLLVLARALWKKPAKLST
jgi:hypothetical protein